MKLILALFAFSLINLSLMASDINWDPEIIDSQKSVLSDPSFSKKHSTVLSLLNIYQTSISSKSISRCPFETSCSQLFKTDLNQNGLCFALIRFIDRNQFRENPGIYKLYPYRFDIKRNKIIYNDNLYLFP